MRADRRRHRWFPVIGAVLLGGCAGTFAGPDLDRVQALTRAPVLPEVAFGEVAAPPSGVVQRLLERPLDREAAVRIALLNNRALRASLREIGVARGRLVQARLLPDPVLELERPLEPEIRHEVGIEYELTEALLAPVRARVAAADLEAGRLRAAGEVVDLVFAVRSAFHAVQAAAQKLAIARRALDALAAGRDAARALAAAGNVSELVLAAHEAAYERARPLVAQLELELASAREALHRLLGLHGAEVQWRLAGALLPAPVAPELPRRLEAQAVAASLELAEARSRLEGVARRTGLARAEGWLPDLSVAVRTGTLEHEVGTRERRWAAGLALSIPLFDRNQGTVHALGAEFDGLLERYHGAAVEVRSAAREAQSRLASAHARARQYQAVILPAQEKLTAQTVLQFNAMQVSVFQLLAARREQLAAEMAYVETLREYWTAVAALEALLAGRRPGRPVAGSTAALSDTDTAGGH
jgi:outer membrane protein TolC